jgi:beta-glucosidase
MRPTRALLAAATAALALLAPRAGAQSPPPDPAVEAKVDALLARMTLDEKIGQMVQADLAALKDRNDIAKYFLGSVLCGGNSDPDPSNTPQAWAAASDDCQRIAFGTRLRIPLIFGVDAVHGHNNVQGAVIFPHNIGLGASRDAKLVERIARATAEEVAATGIRWAFAPCVAVARDERWGRTYESFGEDPALASELGAAAVRGLQGEKLSADPTSVLACPKHFAGDGGTTGGKDQGNTQGDDAALRAIHVDPYVPAIQAGALTIMPSYSSWNGRKMHGHRDLLTGTLKGDLGFDGLLVSDWAAIDQLDPASYRNCIERSVNAGLDMVMIPNGAGQKNNYVEFIDGLKALVAEGKVPAERIDDAARRVLRVKARMGLLDLDAAPKHDPEKLASLGSPERRALAREAVARSAVLLKNDGKALPIAKGRKIHVAGAAADNLGRHCGGWTVAWQGAEGEVIQGGTTLLAALKKVAPELTYSPDGAGADQADVIVVAIGEKPYAEMFGDSKDLALAADDLALVRRMKATGKPVVTVLFSGRPLILGDALESSDALLAAWLPGTEGDGLADLITGAAKPTARLPHAWPRSLEQVPINHDTPNPKGDPLFPFGHGLSYE